MQTSYSISREINLTTFLGGLGIPDLRLYYGEAQMAAIRVWLFGDNHDSAWQEELDTLEEIGTPHKLNGGPLPALAPNDHETPTSVVVNCPKGY